MDKVLEDFSSYVIQLLNMLQVIGHELHRICDYMKVFSEERLRDLIYGAFIHVLSFLTLANEVFTANSQC